MKVLLFIVILISIALASYAQSYTYNKLIIQQLGDDNFSYDNIVEKTTTGSILLSRPTEVFIDNKKIKLKKEIAENTYIASGCTIKLVYGANDKLKGLFLKKLNKDFFYCIDCPKTAIVAQK